MNDANTTEDSETAADTGRRRQLRESTRRARPLFRRSRALPGIFLTVAFSPIVACSGTPEQQTYEIADRRAEWLDKFSVDKRTCATAGGVIVQERYQPDSIRIGGSSPEVGTRYYCRY